MSVHLAHGHVAKTPQQGVPDDPLLDAAVAALVKNPAASLSEVAVAAGVGRTTLHKRYATRRDLVLALAHRSIDTIEAVLDATGAGGSRPDANAFARLVAAALPHGAYLTFLVRAPEIYADEELAARADALFAPLARCVRAAAPDGLAAASPDWWVVLSLQGQMFAAWDAVEAGLLAPQAAPALVSDWFLHGATGRAGDTPPRTDFAPSRRSR